MEKLKCGEIIIDLKENYDYNIEEMKQIIALETGHILATSETPIKPDKNRIRKLLYVKEIFLNSNIILDQSIFNYIKNEELDGLINVLEQNYKIPHQILAYKNISNFEIFIWKIITNQLSRININAFYKKNLKDKKENFINIDVVGTDALLLEQYLLYINSLNNITDVTSDLLKRIFEILKWFTINNFFSIYKELLYKTLKTSIYKYPIEALCLMYYENFNVTSIFSVFGYSLLIQDDPDICVFMTLALAINPKNFYKHNIDRANRRIILREIDRLYSEDNTIVDIHSSYKLYIKSLDKRIHPKDYKNVFPKAYEFFLHFRTKSKLSCKDTNSEISKFYKDNKTITEIASLVYKNYGKEVFISRFDYFARRAELTREETNILDLLVDIKLDESSINRLEEFYKKRLYKIKIRETAVGHFYTKPTVNADFIECVFNILKLKRDGY